MKNDREIVKQYKNYSLIFTVLYVAVTLLLLVTGILVFVLVPEAWWIGLICLIAAVATCVLFLVTRGYLANLIAVHAARAEQEEAEEKAEEEKKEEAEAEKAEETPAPEEPSEKA